MSDSAPSQPQTNKTPSPAQFAQKSPRPSQTSPLQYSDIHIEEASKFGRISDNGTVFVKDNGSEREVGQVPDATGTDALTFFARRYIDLKTKINLFAARLTSSNLRPHEIDESLKNLSAELEKPDVVGDIDALRKQLDELKNQSLKVKEKLALDHQKAVEKAIEERTKIVEQAENIAKNLNDRTNWRATSEELKKLFESWQEHQKTDARIDKTAADALWKRFSSSRSSFNQARRKWAQERTVARDQARVAKESIISQAEALKSSTNWGQTSRDFNHLMDEWKKSGRVGRKEDDELWTRFRAAADVFFNARQADREKMNESEKENLVKKEALLVKAEALVPVNTEKEAQQARKALSNIQDEWDEIGYVPRSDVRRIEDRLNAVEKQIKAVEDQAWTQKDPEADARKTSFETQLIEQLKELDEQISAETNNARKQALEAEKETKQQWLNAIK